MVELEVCDKSGDLATEICETTNFDFALDQDNNDSLSYNRDSFNIPKTKAGETFIYLSGNSLGLQPKRAFSYIQDELKNNISELNLEKSNLGIEYEAYGLTGRNAISLNNSLEKFAILHDKSELVSCLRVIKSSAEIVYVKKAAALADKAMEAAWKYAHAKENEAKILSEMQSVIFEGGGDYPANELSLIHI